MGKRAKAKAKEMEDICLHCGFFQLHHDKWPDWRPGPEINGESSEAFSDLVRSAIKIVAEVFSMLDEADRMKFYNRVETSLKQIERGPPQSMQDVFEMIKEAVAPKGPIKH